MAFGDKVRKLKSNDKEFQIHVLPASEGLVMAHKLSKLVLPFLTEETTEINFTIIAKSLGDNLGEKEILTMVKRLIKDLAVDNKDISFDDYFASNYGELVQLIGFALKENFSSFFEGLGILGE